MLTLYKIDGGKEIKCRTDQRELMLKSKKYTDDKSKVKVAEEKEEKTDK